jgi:DNA mismatch repair protein MSH5
LLYYSLIPLGEGILNNTKTTLGRSLLRTWLLRPSLSLSTLRARHDALGCFNRAENIVTVNSVHAHLKGIKNMPRVMKALESGKARLSDWQGFVKVIIFVWKRRLNEVNLPR